jgi:cell division septal protein FtsQ
MNLNQRTSRARNRRLSNVRQRRQQHLLDVKVRSRRATQHRIRNAMGVLWKVILLVALCGAGYAGAREGAKRLFFENPDYHVKTIELQTDGTLQREHVLNAADLHEGANIFGVNLARVRDRIQQLPQADEVEVVRK